MRRSKGTDRKVVQGGLLSFQSPCSLRGWSICMSCPSSRGDSWRKQPSPGPLITSSGSGRNHRSPWLGVVLGSGNRQSPHDRHVPRAEAPACLGLGPCRACGFCQAPGGRGRGTSPRPSLAPAHLLDTRRGRLYVREGAGSPRD